MPHPDRRAAWVAASIALPSIVCAACLAGLEVYRLMQPEAPVFGGPPPSSLAESIIEGFGVEQTYQFIHAGQDPNEPLHITHPDYTEGETIAASPLMLAAAAQDGSAVVMLLSFGARLDLPQNRNVECLARELKNGEVLKALADRRGESPPPDCTGRRPGAATPLLAWAD